MQDIENRNFVIVSVAYYHNRCFFFIFWRCINLKYSCKGCHDSKKKRLGDFTTDCNLMISKRKTYLKLILTFFFRIQIHYLCLWLISFASHKLIICWLCCLLGHKTLHRQRACWSRVHSESHYLAFDTFLPLSDFFIT